MAKEPSLALQEAIRTVLIGDAQLMSIVTGVFDDVPQDTAYPYIEIGDFDEFDNGTKTEDGLSHTVELHAWSSFAGNTEVKTIMGHLDRLLHNAALTLVDHKLVQILRESRITVRDIDPRIRQGIVRYRALTETL